jgi:hypothetical protein
MPLQIVADLDENGRASIAKEKLHNHADHGVGVAWAKYGIDLLHEEKLEERPDHPDRLPSIGWKRFSHDAIIKFGSGLDTCSAISTEDNDGIVTRVSPMLGKTQRHTLDPSRFETMDGNGNSHAG